MTRTTARSTQRKRAELLQELQDEKGVKLLGKHNGKFVIAFCGYKPNIENGIIDTDVELSVQHSAMAKLDENLNVSVNPKLWSIACAEIPQYR